MSSTAIEIRQPQQVGQWKSPTEIKNRIIAIQQLMDAVLKPGTKENGYDGDFGIIPGTGNKPSLWKSGSEQILAMFEIAVEPVVEDLSTNDCFRYRVTAKLYYAPTQIFLGAGIGEASTDETKYRWKRCYSQKEFDATDPERRKIKYSQYKDSNGMWADKEEMLIRTEAADLANTVLKMAKKRAQIDATLTVTGASSMFAQDLEDLLDEDEAREETRTRKQAKPQPGVKCSECNAEGGHLPSCSKRKTAEKVPDVKKAAEVKQPEPKPAPKADGPTICSECRQAKGHAPDCKFAEKKQEAKSEPKPPALCSIKSVTQKMKGQSKEPYLVLDVVAADGQEGKLYCWDKKMHDYLVGKRDVTLLCQVTAQKTKDDKTFYQLDSILELGGVQFVDNKPVARPEAAADDIEDLFNQ